LYRGVASHAESARRFGRLINPYPGITLAVDFFNVLFTISNYLYGRILYRSTDGLVRDNGEEFPRQKPGPLLVKASELFSRWLDQIRPGSVFLYADTDYEGYHDLKETIFPIFTGKGPFRVAFAEQGSSDRILMKFEDGPIATADSALIDSTFCPVVDAAAHTLETAFSPDLPDLRACLSLGPGNGGAA
jgi:hypothetical protein